MTPEQDPAICAQLDAAVEQIAQESEAAVIASWAQFAETHDRGHVPGRLAARFAGLVQRYGFTMSRADLSGERALGLTGGDWPILPLELRRTVRIEKNLSPASEARVMAHECAHVILGHPGLTPDQAIAAMNRRIALVSQPGMERGDPDEEVAVELAAGAFCKVAGIGTGLMPPMFVWLYQRGRPVKPEALAAAKLAARILYAAAKPALTERTAA